MARFWLVSCNSTKEMNNNKKGLRTKSTTPSPESKASKSFKELLQKLLDAASLKIKISSSVLKPDSNKPKVGLFFLNQSLTQIIKSEIHYLLKESDPPTPQLSPVLSPQVDATPMNMN